MRRAPFFLIFLILTVVMVFTCTFRVAEWQQALVIELGKIERRVSDPGLHFKLPFMQTVKYFEKRVLEYDAPPREIITGDKQQLVVDNYSRWRITNLEVFYRKLKTIESAWARLDEIIYSVVREKLGRFELIQIVSDQRESLMEEILMESRIKAQDFGIFLIDVRIKRTDLPESNKKNVFARMRAEREREAKRFRAEGEEEARKIRSTAEKEARILVAEARKQSEVIRGKGDAESTRVYAAAYNQDPEFYGFVRSLESYRKVIAKGTTIVLSSENEFLKTFKTGR